MSCQSAHFILRGEFPFVQKPFLQGNDKGVTIVKIKGFYLADRVERGRIKNEKRGLKR